jgi:AraC-like DNA-binding protein
MESLFQEVRGASAAGSAPGVAAVPAAHRRCATPAGAFVRLPMPWLALTVAWGDDGLWQDMDGRWQRHPRIALRGLFDGPSRALEPTVGRVDYVCALVEPWACMGLFGLPAAELKNRIVDVQAFDPALARRLHDVAASPAPLQAALAVLRQRMEQAPAPDRALCRAVQGLQARGGGGAIGGVRAAGGEDSVSARSMRQRFVRSLGVPPKRYARLLRLALALRDLHARPWALPHAESGDHGGVAEYHDASHLAREFRALAGCTPGEYRRAKRGGVRTVFTRPCIEAEASVARGPPPER